ncbi:ATP phosphoribosyltransferase regulatory subunit [Roseospira visakhapatnamensis]|uniref:ATP phosphoribosyltransferase regulatory subunit n=1 Tax=Roseospira visakhapatnamensis TaxID=390880 RepID=A0A7W6RCM1_9PROT|nr:ATP phosphoribosyltransferase regulatory subunit [Roseospira visakhapatnamensis]MBB4265957.1 ATP phosphoribosyltransferase regulatory subunit [Roseospira visakhapatnamensis]
MTDTPNPALLPNGLSDGLPPRAEHEAAIGDRLLAVVRGHGYQRVKPPLIEFEESLLSGTGRALVHDTFRVMDPVSQRMMGVRPDFTVQIGRIATSRLHQEPRPLRLCYAGQVLRVRGSQLRPERQFTQVGAELIGADEAITTVADAEVVVMAAEALQTAGVTGATIDLTLPTLPAVLFDTHGVPAAARPALRAALDQKDTAAVRERAPSAALGDLLVGLIRATGPADEALAAMAALDLPPAAAQRHADLAALVARIQAARPDPALTVDPLEGRGFEYYTGFGFSIFAPGARGELARGGRYTAGRGDRVEQATGFTVMMDAVLDAIPAPVPPARVLAPEDADPRLVARLRAEGWVVLDALRPLDDPAAEARRLGCSHGLGADGPVVLG